MGRMFVLDSSGHTEFAWSPADESTTESARAEFGRLRRGGYVPFGKRKVMSEPEQVREFDPSLTEIFWIRPVVGG